MLQITQLTVVIKDLDSPSHAVGLHSSDKCTFMSLRLKVILYLSFLPCSNIMY